MDDYICITDMASAKSDNSRAADVVKNWLRTRNTSEFLGTWEQIYNSGFKVVEFDHFKQQLGLLIRTLLLNGVEKISSIECEKTDTLTKLITLDNILMQIIEQMLSLR